MLTVEHKIRTAKGVETVTLTPMKAIRRKCLDCCGWDAVEVRNCTSVLCPLYPYRMGYIRSNPTQEAPADDNQD